jgi:hypothetical protein
MARMASQISSAVNTPNIHLSPSASPALFYHTLPVVLDQVFHRSCGSLSLRGQLSPADGPAVGTRASAAIVRFVFAWWPGRGEAAPRQTSLAPREDDAAKMGKDYGERKVLSGSQVVSTPFLCFSPLAPCARLSCPVPPALARPNRAPRPGCRAVRERGSVGPHVPARGA